MDGIKTHYWIRVAIFQVFECPGRKQEKWLVSWYQIRSWHNVLLSKNFIIWMYLAKLIKFLWILTNICNNKEFTWKLSISCRKWYLISCFLARKCATLYWMLLCMKFTKSFWKINWSLERNVYSNMPCSTNSLVRYLIVITYQDGSLVHLIRRSRISSFSLLKFIHSTFHTTWYVCPDYSFVKYGIHPEEVEYIKCD